MELVEGLGLLSAVPTWRKILEMKGSLSRPKSEMPGRLVHSGLSRGPTRTHACTSPGLIPSRLDTIMLSRPKLAAVYSKPCIRIIRSARRCLVEAQRSFLAGRRHTYTGPTLRGMPTCSKNHNTLQHHRLHHSRMMVM